LVNNFLKYKNMKIVNNIRKIALILATAFIGLSCDDNTDNIIEKKPTIEEQLKANPNFSVLALGLRATGLYNTFVNPGSYTVFAPENSSFAAYTSTNFPSGVSEAVLTPLLPPNVLTSAQQMQVNELKRLLMNHVVGTATLAVDLPEDGYIRTLSPLGTSTSVSLSAYVNKSNGVKINGEASNGGVTVTEADILASNGVIHKVDNLLKLPTLVNHLVANPSLSTLVSVATDPAQAAVLAQISTPANNTQIFAPNNAAFTAATLPTTAANISKVLRYHLVTGVAYTRQENIGTSNQTANSASSGTTYLPTTATTDGTATTRQPVTGTATPFQTFRIERNSIKLFENPAVTTPASMVKTVNIQASNGVIHIIDRVLIPVL
jgi:uncharacterized surface protein with fasciclin (FAS1) repeats